MEIQDRELEHNGRSLGTLFATAKEMCDMVTRPQAGMPEIKRQVELGQKINEAEGTVELSPEDATLLRELVALSALPPVFKVLIHDAFEG